MYLAILQFTIFKADIIFDDMIVHRDVCSNDEMVVDEGVVEKQFGKKHFAIVLNKIYSLNSVDFHSFFVVGIVSVILSAK